MDAVYVQSIVSVVTAVLTLLGVIITVEHGNRVRDVQTDNKIATIQERLDTSIANIEKTVNGLEKKQDAYNNVIARMYEAERKISVIQEHEKVQDDDLRDCKHTLANLSEKM